MPIPISSASERRLAANRANAQLSTGPVTAESKARSSLNAVKTGLTGRTVLLPSEDVAAYQEHIDRYQQEFQPADERERTLVQNLADTQWRLNRIPGLETGLYALGRMRYADLFAEEKNPQVRNALLDAHILMTDAKYLKNLHLQESRLRRQYKQDLQELEALQAQRKEAEVQETKRKTVAPAQPHGFEFANSISLNQNSQPRGDHQETDHPRYTNHSSTGK